MKEKMLLPVLQKPILGMEILSVLVALCSLKSVNEVWSWITILSCVAVRCVVMIYYLYATRYQIWGLGELYTVLPFSKKKKTELLIFSSEKGLWLRSAIVMGMVVVFGMPQYVWFEIGFLFLCCLLQNIEFCFLSKSAAVNIPLYIEVILCFAEFFLLAFGCFLQEIVAMNGTQWLPGIRSGRIAFLLIAGVSYVVIRTLSKKYMGKGV